MTHVLRIENYIEFPFMETKLSFYKNIRELTKKDIYNRIPTDLRRYVHSNDKNYNGVI